jgi:hypothetical protein
MDTEVQVVDATQGSANLAEQQERAQIDMQIATAKKYPMHSPETLSACKERMLSFATLDEETASGCFYTLPRGGKAITGPSVRMAEIAIGCYGNIRVQTKIVEVVAAGTTPHVVVQAVAHDLETNSAISIEKRRRITKKRNKPTVDEDDIQLAVNACAAIAYRDAAFKVVPQALIKPVWQAARLVSVGDLKSLVAKRTQVMEGLAKMGATEDRVLSVVDARKIDDIDVDKLQILIGLGTALKDGETTLEDAFPHIVEQKQGTNALLNRLDGKDENFGATKKKPAKKTKAKKKDEPKEEVAPPEPAPPTEMRYFCKGCDREADAVGHTPDGTLKCIHCLATGCVLDRENVTEQTQAAG